MSEPFERHPLHEEWMAVITKARQWRHNYNGNNSAQLRSAVDRLERVESAVIEVAQQIERTKECATHD